MRNTALVFVVLLGSVAFAASRPNDAGVIDRSDSFAEKTVFHSYTLDLSGKGCIDLKFGGQITSGRIVWHLVDPTGKERMAVQTTRRASGVAEDIKAIPGKWTLTVKLENATGQSWVRWQP